MSLPNELREQLLSGYLDDALSADERARVDHLLASDAEFADELEQLREIQATLLTISASEDEIKLRSDFAERILDAAVAQARFEGLNEDHPLLRLAEQPSLSRNQRSVGWRLPVGIAALAASIAFAIFAIGFGNRQDPIAENPVSEPTRPESMSGEDAVPGSPEPGISEPGISEPGISEPGTSESPMLANGPNPLDATNEEQLQAAASNPTVTPEMVARGNPEIAPLGSGDGDATSEAIAAIQSPTPAVRRNQVNEQMLLGGSPVMVYSVQLTDSGKENDAVNAALADAQIGAARQQKVSDEIAGFFTENDGEPGDPADSRVLYLQAPLKNLDRFYLNLMADEKGIAQVGMTIAFNTPMRRVVDSLNVNPTTVQHDGRVLELVGNTTVVSQIASELEQLPFSFDRSKLLKVQNDGPDEMGQVLLLVHP